MGRRRPLSRIVEQLDALVPQGSLSREDAAQQLKATRMAYALLVWKIYNAHKQYPRNSCGVIYQSAHVSAVARLMEDLLRAVVEQRNELKLWPHFMALPAAASADS